MKRRVLALLISFSVVLCLMGTGAITASAQTLNNNSVVQEDGMPRLTAIVITDASKYAEFTPAKCLDTLSDGNTDYGFGTLNTSEKKAYSLLKKAAAAKAVNLLLNISNLGLTSAQASKVFNCFYYDNPQLFWMSGSYGLLSENDNDGGSVAMDLVLFSLYKTSSGSIDTDTISKLQEAIDSSAKVYLNAVKNVSSEYEKELILHDMILNNTVYDKTTNKPDEDYTIVGSLIENVARGTGYSRTFQYLLGLAGIDSILVIGTANSQAHAWNIVKIDGNYYQTDISWDCFLGTGFDTLSHGYLNLTDSEMSVTHAAGSSAEIYALPACTATADNYFIRSGSYYSSADSFIPKVVSTIVSSINSGNYDVEIKASSPAMFKKINEMLFNGSYSKECYSEIIYDIRQQLNVFQASNGSYIYSEDSSLNTFTFHIMHGTSAIDKTSLAQKIIYAKLYFNDSSDFTGDSYSDFDSALCNAQSVNFNKDATQYDTDYAAYKLQLAIDYLEIGS